jgi:hypothetical protein
MSVVSWQLAVGSWQLAVGSCRLSVSERRKRDGQILRIRDHRFRHGFMPRRRVEVSARRFVSVRARYRALTVVVLKRVDVVGQS